MIIGGHINRRPVQVVLDSAGTRFDDPSRFIRARRMRQHAREHGQFAVSDGNMVRVSRERGLSLAAQLEHLLPQHSGWVFIVLSSQQVYMALLHEGLVYTEEARSVTQAEQALEAESGQVMVIDTAERRDFAEAFTGTALALSSQSSWYYRPLWRVLLRHGLPHPLHLLALLVPLLLVVAGVTVHDHRTRLAEGEAAMERQLASLRNTAKLRQHPAHAHRQMLAWADWLRELETYRTQGLVRAFWDGVTVSLQGQLTEAEPERLQGIALSRNEKLRLSEQSWQVERELQVEESDSGPKRDPIDLADWLSHADPSLRLVDATLLLGKSTVGLGYTRYQLRLEASRGDVAVFSLLANLLQGMPARMDVVSVNFERALPVAASVEFSIWGN